MGIETRSQPQQAQDLVTERVTHHQGAYQTGPSSIQEACQ
jgi:hypothetical protein